MCDNYEPQIGDSVVYQNQDGQHPAKVIDIYQDSFGYTYGVDVEFDDKSLCPPTMFASLKNIVYSPKKQVIEKTHVYGPVDKVCPKCGTAWHRSSFGHKVCLIVCLAKNARKIFVLDKLLILLLFLYLFVITYFIVEILGNFYEETFNYFYNILPIIPGV